MTSKLLLAKTMNVSLVHVLIFIDWQVSPDEMEAFDEIKATLSDKESGKAYFINSFNSKGLDEAVKSLRYRAEVFLLHLSFTID